VIAELVKIQKKTEINELKKISEIILTTFRENKKLTGENLFEASLAAINQSLADFAHEGKKSWLGKFSALIALKSSDNIFVANSGHTLSMLYRDGNFMEILPSEKRGIHPLKTFSNFVSGKVKSEDMLLLTSANLLSFVALQNLNNILSGSKIEDAVDQVTKILRDTAGDSEGFASFFVSFNKMQPHAEPEILPSAPSTVIEEAIEETIIEPAPLGHLEVSPLPQQIKVPVTQNEIYAPLPGQITKEKSTLLSSSTRIFDRLPKVRVPKLSWKVRTPAFFQALSPWAKFFFISFLIFMLLLASNVVALIIRKHQKASISETQSLVNQLTQDINDTESALIYRNQDQAIRLLTSAQAELARLKGLDEQNYNQLAPQVSNLAMRVNHITVIQNPNILLTLKHTATDLVRAGKGFVIADADSSNIATYNTSSADTAGKDLFLLNKIGQIKGAAHIPNTGHLIATSSELYLVNTAQSQFDLVHIYPGIEFSRLKFLSPDRLYTIDKPANQVLRIQFSKSTQNNPVSLLKTKADLSQTVDFGVDNDIYILNPTALQKYTNGSLSSFSIVQPTDQITSANRLFVANNLYILESAKKRLLVYNKQGALITQMFFPTSTDMKDLYVDESSRNIYILDSNRILSITF
jgi:hypothetical protein